MTRPMAGSTRAELSQATVEPFLLVEGLFDSGALRFWTGSGDLSWAGKTWLGAGDLLSIENLGETSEVRAPGMRVQLSGIASSILSLALSEAYQGRPLLVYVGFLSAGAVVPTPVLVFSGRMDTMRIQEAGDTATVELTAENRLVDLERSNERRYTHEDQQIDFPGDLGLEFVATTRHTPAGGEGFGGGGGGPAGGGPPPGGGRPTRSPP